MTDNIKKIIKIIICIILIIGIIGFTWSLWNTEEETPVDLLKIYLQNKQSKKECLDNLNYEETIEEYKGLFHCNQWDERIKDTKEKLNQYLVREYEKVDENIKQKQKEKLLTDSWMSSYEKLTAFLEAE